MPSCTHPPHRQPLHCIVPPYMLERIAQNGTPAQRALAQKSLELTRDLRQDRAVTQQAIAKGQDLSGAVSMSTGVAPAKMRFTYTGNFGSTLPGQLVRQEGSPPCGDRAIDEAHDGAGLTFDLFWHAFQRNSIDNRGLPMRSTAHYQQGYDNAFWNGTQMVYGDGDEDLPVEQRLFNRFTCALDVIAHELAHGVNQYEANLAYSSQSGALNESMSDVFGALVKQYAQQQDARSADWIIGQGLFTPNVNGVGIRSMKAPGTAYNDPLLGADPQPGHMSSYVNTTQDNGGVHINSGIPNRAFYVTAYELGGNAWEKAGQIWYKVLCDRLTNTSVFQNAADLTLSVAGELFGAGSREQQAVRLGWAEVGIQAAGSVSPAPTSTGCLTALASLLKSLRVNR